MAPPACCPEPAKRAVLPSRPAMATAKQPRPDRLVRLPGGRFRVGTDSSPLPQDGEAPARMVDIQPFSIDPLAVTNAAFAAFVAATGYRSEAERYGWSLVFRSAIARPAWQGSSSQGPTWWRRVEGACWRAPEGPGSDVAARADHPVVQVSWHDATAFATWAGGRLPSEAEWEYAAAAGRTGARFPWGAREPDDTGFQPCNIWQGRFPTDNTLADGYAGTAPADAFEPNGFGLHNMAGNVWEWNVEPFRIRPRARAPRARDATAWASNARLLKGGSFLCHRSYCYRYRIAARTWADSDSATAHVGFRLAFDLV